MSTTPRRPKGTGSVRQRGDGWQARYSYVDAMGRRRQRSQLHRTRTEARRWLTEELAKAADGRVADAGTVTLGEYLTDWLGSLGMAQLEPTTLSWYRSAVERHIAPALGAVRLAKLTPVAVEAFLADKAQSGRLDGTGGLGAASVRRLQVTMHKALDAAVRKGLLPRNPVDDADRPTLPAQDVTLDVWTPDEVAAFLAVAEVDRLAALWRTAAMTGLRRSEVCGLRWPDLDRDAGRLSVRRAVVIADGRVHVKPPKTAKSRRSVELDAGTVAALRGWRRRQLEDRLRAGEAWEDHDEPVFTDELGRAVRPDWVTKRFARLVEGAGLRPITLRQLRHSHATALLAGGAHPKVVQERLGHSSISVTLDVYSAVLPTMQRDAVERLARMFEAR